MAYTSIKDVIVPELFEPYVVNRSVELSAFVQSGVMTHNAFFDNLASEPAPLHHMPFFSDLTGDAEATIEGEKTNPAKISSSQDVSTTIRRRRSWSASSLSAQLAGADPMRAIGDLVASYWTREYQKELIAILNGVFGTHDTSVTPMKDHILDISAGKGAAVIDVRSFMDACQLLGDSQDQLTAVAMHSATFTALKKQNLIETIRPADNASFMSYQGRRVIIDDGIPVTGDVYTTYLFGKGAIAFGIGHPLTEKATEFGRDPYDGAGVDTLFNRKTFIMHPRGIKWTNAVRVHQETPLRTELSDAKNWQPVYQPKQIRIVAFKHKIA